MLLPLVVVLPGVREDEPLVLALTVPVLVPARIGVGGVWMILGGGVGAADGRSGSLALRRCSDDTRDTIDGIGGRTGGPPGLGAVEGRGGSWPPFMEISVWQRTK